MLSDLLYQYRTGFDKIAAIAVISRKGDVLAINERFQDLFGYTEAELIGRPISILRSPVTPISTHHGMWQGLLENKQWSGEIVNCRKTGEMIWVRCSINLWDQLENKQPGVYLVMYQDINDEVIARKSKEERQAEEIRQSFLAGALHNIGNLQTIVASTLSSLADQTNSFSQACSLARSSKATLLEKPDLLEGVLNVIETQAGKLSELVAKSQNASKKVNDVLESFREIQKNTRTISASTPLSLLCETIESVSFHAATQQIQLSLGHCDEETANREIHWPVKQLQQVLFNLIKNAAEAIEAIRQQDSTHRGRIELDIQPNPLNPEYSVQITVTDNGGGIALSKDQVFQQGATTKSSGLGLGLHNSALFITSMGGTIGFDPILLDGKPGTCFRIALPNQVSELMPGLNTNTGGLGVALPNLSKAEKMERIAAIGSALSKDPDSTTILKLILEAAMDVTNADAGSLFRVSGDRERLILAASKNLSLGTLYQEKAVAHPGFSSLPLRRDGVPIKDTIAAAVFNEKRTVAIEDVDTAIEHGTNLSGAKAADGISGYKTISLLTTPIVFRDSSLGVLQVINSIDPASGQICSFSSEEQVMVEQLSNYAALALSARSAEV